MIKLGMKCRDVVSGWEGIALARYEYLNGCVRFELGAADKDGKPESFVFDREQVEPVEGAEPVHIIPRQTGGPRSNKPVPR